MKNKKSKKICLIKNQTIEFLMLKMEKNIKIYFQD